MRSRRKSRDEVGMNLFPFLAVLICTMGSIIMLLVVMVQQARVRAQESTAYDVAALQSAKAAADDAIAKHEQRRQQIESAIAEQQRRIADYQKEKELADDAQMELEDLKWKIETLQPAYEKTLEDVAEQRLRLSHLEQHTRELSEKASQMQAEADLIAKTARSGAQNVEADQQKLQELKRELAAAEAQLDAEREKLANRRKQYALVAYDGPSGTQRPPIYIECLPDRVILQPENVVLIGEDFRAPVNDQNPLASALRAKREFMMENGMLSEGEEPYPLLVVRPNSASSYAAARSAMTAWESEFGYELVESEIELNYQVADPRLTTMLQDVVIEARGRRKMMFAMMKQRRPRQRELLRPSMSGGFEVVSNGSGATASRSLGSNASGTSGGAFDRASTGPFTSKDNGAASRQTVESPIGNRADGFPSPPEGFGGNGFGKNDSATPNSGAPYSGARDSGGSDGTNESGPNAGLSGRTSNRFEAKPQTSTNAPGETGNQLRFGDESQSSSRGAANSNGQGSKSAKGAGGPSSQVGPSAGAASPSNSPNFSATQSLAQTRGSGWAIGGKGANAVGVKRPIRLVCDGEKLQLIPERGSGDDLAIFQHGGNVSSVVDPFVEAVQSRVRGWGFAGQGLFWRPILHVQVQGQADAKYGQLLRLLDQSGIEVTREP